MSISVTGNGFLYNMVRIIAGTLVYVGIGKLTPEDVSRILETGDRKAAGKTLGAKGLTLMYILAVTAAVIRYLARLKKRQY